MKLACALFLATTVLGLSSCACPYTEYTYEPYVPNEPVMNGRPGHVIGPGDLALENYYYKHSLGPYPKDHVPPCDVPLEESPVKCNPVED